MEPRVESTYMCIYTYQKIRSPKDLYIPNIYQRRTYRSILISTELFYVWFSFLYSNTLLLMNSCFRECREPPAFYSTYSYAVDGFKAFSSCICRSDVFVQPFPIGITTRAKKEKKKNKREKKRKLRRLEVG